MMKSTRFLFLMLGLWALVLSGCRSTITEAIGEITPGSVVLSGSSKVSPTTTFSFKNISSSPITYTVTESLDWLSIPTGASAVLNAGATARVKLKATCTEIGTLSGTIDITAGTETKPVDIELKCTATAPAISEPSPGIITLAGGIGRSFVSSFSFENIGDENLTFTVIEDAPWLEVTSNASGTLIPGASINVGLKATCGDTESETTTSVVIDSNASDQNVNVSLTCSATPTPSISEPNPSSIEKIGAVGGNYNLSFSFDSIGDINLIYTLAESVDWLEITSSKQGTLPSGESLTVNLRATCPAKADTYTTTVTINSNASDQDQIVTVTLICSGNAILGDITPNPLELVGQVSTSTSSNFTLQNSGGADLTYSISSNQTWLTVSPTTGTIKPQAVLPLTALANCADIAGQQTATITITTNDPTQPTATLPVTLECSSNKVSQFSIQLQYVGTVSDSRKASLERAAARWSKILIGDLPNIILNKNFNLCGLQEPELNGLIDDVIIAVAVGPIDGQGNIFADSGPCAIRSSSLPMYSTIKLDAADITAFEASGDLDEIMLREVGIALGFGSLWQKLNKLNYKPDASACASITSFSTRPTFNGVAAKTRFNALGVTGSPPIEDGLNAEVRCSSWDEGVFDNELMSSVFDSGKDNLLSLLSVASMTDLGYETDPSQASPYSLPACSPNCLQAPTLLRDIARQPIVDQYGLKLNR
jgi:Viral BACON domain/Leishmanolysin